MDTQSHVFRIQRFCIHDGPGIRTTVFFQGCPLKCAWCHNPESQQAPPQLKSQHIQGICHDLLETIEKDRIFYEESGGGVTFSGGEPLGQPDLLAALAGLCRERGIHTCLDTSGFAPPAVLERAVQDMDLMLYDVKLAHDATHREFTGQKSGPVFDNLAALSDRQFPLLMRMPLVPGMTHTEDNIRGLMTWIRNNTIYRQIHLLPFHRTGQGKYQELGMENRMKDVSVPTFEEIEAAMGIWASSGFNVTIGG